ncbi:Splicing factor-like protein 1 [Vitis vinifera]|uniref:Branchpoint-bridging protein n=1 Tax=Vitis vinifera TaxID=29760 RepID=A0A438CV24_VITVI|nr:Splicing factor-like protein 1 [Vitis vinifera]
MEKNEASYLSRIRKKYSIEVDKPNKVTTVELQAQCVLQSFLDRDNDESEEWELDEFVSLSGYNDEKEQPIEDPDMDSLGKSVSKSSSDSDPDEAEAGLEAISRSLIENKGSLDVIANEPAPLQDFQTLKKCKQDESSNLEADVGSVVADLHDKSGVPMAPVTDESASEKQEHAGSSGKRRLSRRDQKPEVDGETDEGNRTRKRRKTRWTGDDSQLKILGPIQLPSFVKDFVTSDLDPEIQELKVELFEINSKLQRPELHDDCPKEDRSPSPEPVLIEKNSTFKPAADYKPPKLIKKLYIPEKEYPDYNFVGLIIGPRGNTQKRMEKETGAKILLRGKGYSLKTPRRTKASDNEDLHVRIEADNQNSFDAAVRMVEKLLIPIDRGINAHQQAQLVELGKLNGERNKNMCRCCYDEGHPHYACPHLQSTFQSSLSCDICGSNNHATPSCPLIASSQGSNSLWGSSGLEIGSTPDTQSKPNKETSDADLYVGYLPQTMDENCLAELFAPFGKIAKTKVIKDRATGISKGYGFVKFENPAHAALALSHMHGYKIDGKTLAVREGTRQWVTGSSVLSPDPNHPGSIAASQDAVRQTGFPVPPGSLLPQHQTMFPETKRMALPPPATYHLGRLIFSLKARDWVFLLCPAS